MTHRPFGIATVVALARGVRFRWYDCGRDSPAREDGVHHVHRLFAEFVNG